MFLFTVYVGCFCLQPPHPCNGPHSPAWGVRAVPRPGSGRLGRDSARSTSAYTQTGCLPKVPGHLPSHGRGEGAPLLGCKLESRVLSTKGFSGHPPAAWEDKPPGQKGEVISGLLQMARLPRPRAISEELGLTWPATALIGSRRIMSFYELWGPRGTRMNVKRACQPRSPGACHTLTK